MTDKFKQYIFDNDSENKFVETYKDHVCYDQIYDSTNVCEDIIANWITETKAAKNHLDFLDKYKENLISHGRKLYILLSEVEHEEIENKSFINFIRHFQDLNNYIQDRNYYISVHDGIVRLQIWHEVIHLVLHFRNDFLIDFYSYDKDPNDKEDSLVYSMKGCFSSSSSLKKSYKIERLLSVFNKAMKLTREAPIYKYGTTHIKHEKKCLLK